MCRAVLPFSWIRQVRAFNRCLAGKKCSKQEREKSEVKINRDNEWFSLLLRQKSMKAHNIGHYSLHFEH